MNNEFRFKIKMLWEHRKKIINIKGIYAPNRKWAERKLKMHIDTFYGCDYEIKQITEIMQGV